MNNIPQDNPQKQCSACKQFLPATTDIFHRSKASKDGLAYTCKKCKKAYDEQYNEANREKKNAQSRAYHQSHRAQRLVQYKERQAKHKDEKAAYDKQYRERNKEKIKERRDVYYQANKFFLNERRKLRPCDREGQHRRQRKYEHSPRGRMKKRVAKHQRRARELSANGSYTLEQIQEQLKRQKYRCYYAACGHAKFQKKNGTYIYQIEHTFPLGRDNGDAPVNDISYLVLACPSCNQSKNRRFPWEWPEGGRLL